MLNIGYDEETFYSKDYSVVDLGYDRYARDPRFERLILSVSDGAESWCGRPEDFNWDSLTGNRVIIHNRPFDWENVTASMEQGIIPQIRPAEVVCTLDMSAYLWNVRSLKDAARIGLGANLSKGIRDRAKGKHWADIVAEGWDKDFIQYGATDAVMAVQLWNKYSDRWPAFERRLSDITWAQGRYGVKLDVDKLHEGMLLMQQVILSATENLPWVKRGRKPASPLGLHEECKLAGIDCPPVKAHDAEGAIEWEEKYAPNYPFVMALRDLRKAKKALATLETMKLRMRPDNTIAFSLKYAGAHTLRWAGDGGLNFQNFGKEPLFVEEGGFVYDTKELVGKFRKDQELPESVQHLDIRGLIVAREGCVLAPVDLAQIEPRVLNWLAGNFKLLDLVRQGYAIYEAYARAVEHYEGPSIKENDPQYYQYLKVKVLGLGYGAGWEKAIVIGKMYDVDLTAKDDEYAKLAAVDGKIHLRGKYGEDWVYLSAPNDARAPKPYTEPNPTVSFDERVVFVEKTKWVNKVATKVLVVQPVYGQQARYEVKKFRTDNPDVVALWDQMQKALVAAVGSDLEVECPDGGKMLYREVRQEARNFTDSDTGEVQRRLVLTALVGDKRVILHGPKLVENLTQRVSRMVFAEGLVRAEDEGLQNLFTVHDEDVPEVPLEAIEAYGEEAIISSIEEIFSVTPEWLPGCPINAECKLTPRYKK